MVQPFWKTGWRFFNTFRIELPHEPAISFLGILYTQENVKHVKIKACSEMFIKTLFITYKNWKQSKMTIN